MYEACYIYAPPPLQVISSLQINTGKNARNSATLPPLQDSYLGNQRVVHGLAHVSSVFDKMSIAFVHPVFPLPFSYA